ncbi:molybdopterin-guanine dinucleotide biosynthesis protein MobA [Actinomyces sp. 2119]|uniref:molybdenum cofactor guanylyltransferase n=1 Tax=Actinomyces sp. 2119 TaxID=2321393 RepID=UPI000E6BC9C7|nr:molybdopterin-guanine dinucleotide biosynthesis protein MobA [Actinomyces sp. 2119]
MAGPEPTGRQPGVPPQAVGTQVGSEAVGCLGSAPTLDAVVLAGGTGRRLGGASKPDVVARGARLLDHVLRGLDQLRHDGVPMGLVCVVAPQTVALPQGVLRALEDPPLGGPVAGVAAGLARLSRARPPRADKGHQAARTCADLPATGPGGPAPLTAVLTCDAPQGWRALPELLRACTETATSPDGTADEPGRPQAAAQGACALQDGYVQYLLGVYHTGALEQAVAPGGTALRDTAVRRALGRMDVRAVPLRRHPRAAHDLDTWEEVRAWDQQTSPREARGQPGHRGAAQDRERDRGSHEGRRKT